MAIAGWSQWSAETSLEDAPYPELRLLPSVYAHLSRAAPGMPLPQKLKGKARATFTQNAILTHGSREILAALVEEGAPVLLAKGVDFCFRFNAWSRRPMGDIDIYVPEAKLALACGVLAKESWTPRYGLTWASLIHRTSLRRESWNITKEFGNLDLHWRLHDAPGSLALEKELWAAAETVDFNGLNVRRPSPEFALLLALQHGLLTGTRSDILQMVVDSASWLSICNAAVLDEILERSAMRKAFDAVREVHRRIGADVTFPIPTRRGFRNNARPLTPDATPPEERVEAGVLRSPQRYAEWIAHGRRPRMERSLLKTFGPFSEPLAPPAVFSDDYDLRDCAVMDQIGGPGWGWPEPEHTCFWSDRADARLLIKLRRRTGHMIVLSLAGNQRSSPNPVVKIFANGHPLTKVKPGSGLEVVLLIKKSYLVGAWVELSLRPRRFRGNEARWAAVQIKRSIAASRLRVFEMSALSSFLRSTYPSDLSTYPSDLLRRILLGEEPFSSKFGRIRQKIADSPFQEATELPEDFDPIGYVLLYQDLFEEEVDPYNHFIYYGREEGRRWKT